MKNTGIYLLLICSLLLLFTFPVSAAVLTFDIAGIRDNGAIPQEYGDRIISETMGNYSYGTAGGITPNVEVAYLGNTGGNLGTDLSFWGANFTGVSGVLNNEDDGEPLLQVDFIADPGFMVSLDGFDLSTYYGASLYINQLSVIDVATGTTLYYGANFSVAGLNQYDFSSQNTAGAHIRLLLDLTSAGDENDSIGLDNIQFSQTASVPIPSTLLILAVGLLGITAVGRKQNNP